MAFQAEIMKIREEQESIVMPANITKIVHGKNDGYIAESTEADKHDLEHLAAVLQSKFSAEVTKVRDQTSTQIAEVKESMAELAQELKKHTTTIQATLELQRQVIEAQQQSNERMEKNLSEKLDQILKSQAPQSPTLPEKKHTRHSNSPTTLEITPAQQQNISTNSDTQLDHKIQDPTPMKAEKEPKPDANKVAEKTLEMLSL